MNSGMFRKKLFVWKTLLLTEIKDDIRVCLLQVLREEYLGRKPKSGSDVQLWRWRP